MSFVTNDDGKGFERTDAKQWSAGHLMTWLELKYDI